MPISTALGNLRSLHHRQRPPRGQHERLETTERDEHEESTEHTVSTQADSNNNNALTAQAVSQEENEEEDEDMEEVALSQEDMPAVENSSDVENNSDDDELFEDAQADATTNERVGVRRTLTLVELEEERELVRRRTSGCVLIGVFVLFRLWIIAIQSQNFPMLCVCLVFTSWVVRFIRANREYEEELDQRIAEHWNSNGENGQEEDEEQRRDLRGLSFQAQLALAIMESQMQMMQGGYGHPDGHQRSEGVSESIRQEWERYKRKAEKESYGALSQNEEPVKGDLEQGLDEEPSCSICLCEYEDGETLVCLPCGHLYHEDCVMSWTSNHVRCPLCNYDLEESPSAQEESVV